MDIFRTAHEKQKRGQPLKKEKYDMLYPETKEGSALEKGKQKRGQPLKKEKYDMLYP